jgi:3-oxocholest-4-en-26-oyl-CoA dehydrogenase beta subunit
MDFGLNENQEMLQKSAREFLSNEYPDKTLKEMAKHPQGYTPELWHKITDLGWTALAIPEDYGGIGDFLDLVLVLQETGRTGLISPFFTTTVLGAGIVLAAGNNEQKKRYLAEIAEGKSIITLAWMENSARFVPADIRTKAILQGNEYIINGEKTFVSDINSADYLVVPARTRTTSGIEGITLFLVDTKTAGVSYHLLDTIAPDKQGEVRFENVRVPRSAVLGSEHQGGLPLEKVLSRAAVAACAVMVGGAEKVLEMTVAYAKERQAFGHPIGAYQSIQHRCADMLTDVQTARFVTYQAAWCLNEGLTADREVAIAKAWTGQAYRRVVSSAHQVHGAIGFTEDHMLHWYTKRARALEVNFGDVNYHLEKLAALSGLKP